MECKTAGTSRRFFLATQRMQPEVDKLPPNPFLSKRGEWLIIRPSKQKASVPYMEFSEKLTTLRKQAGLSQEQLADRLGVTRQSVSKWESGAAFPELVKIISLSEIFGVSVDYLVKDYVKEPEQADENGPVAARLEQKVDALVSDYRSNCGSYYRYTSKIRLFGLPLVSIRFGRDRNPSQNTLAVGIIAVGNFSVGVVSIGLISAGVFSLGMIAAGAMALGMVSVGWAAVGISVMGIHAAGVAVSKLF